MSADLLANDPIRPLLDREKDSAEIVTDPVYGYDRVYPAEDLIESLGALYADQIEKGDENFKETFRKMREAEDTYEGEPQGATEVLTVPLAKRIINQQIAWACNQILTKDPFITWRPLDGGSYEVPVEVMGEEMPEMPEMPAEGMGGMGEMGAAGGMPMEGMPAIPGMPQTPQQVFRTEELTSEEIATNLEDFTQFRLTACEDFEQLVEDTVHSIQTGENPTYWRVDYDPRVLHAKTRQFHRTKKGGVQIFGVEDTEIVPRNLVRLRHVSGYNVTMSLPAENVQDAWWVAERNPRTNMEMWEGIKTGRYDLGRKKNTDGSLDIDDAVVRKIMGFGENLRAKNEAENRAGEIDALVAEHPRDEHDVRTVYFFHPLLIKQPGGQMAIEIRSLIGELHVQARTFLSITVNWSWTGKRLLVPFFRHKRPHRHSGMSASGDVLPIQALLSSVLHLDVNNKISSNVPVVLIKQNSATWRWFQNAGNELKPMAIIPFDEPGDISVQRLSAPIGTTADIAQFLEGQGEKLLVQDEMEVPNRTAGATVALTQAEIKQQSLALLRGIRRPISKAIGFYVQTVAQFSTHEVIPFHDPKKRRIVSKIIGFPREAIVDHFACRVTATGDEDSAQAQFEKAGLLAGETDLQNEAAMKLILAIFNAQLPKVQRDAAKFMLLRRERLYGERIKSFRLNTQHYVIDDDMIAQWEAELAAEVQAAAEAAAAAAALNPPGGPNAELQGANVGGPVPAEPAPPGQEPLGGGGGQPLLPGMAQPGPPSAVQPPGALVQ